jgi:hypothetical protein
MVDKIVCENKAEYDALKHKAMMAKVVLLDKAGEHPLTNPSLFSDRKKRQFVKDLSEYMERPTDEITTAFGEVVNHTILACGADVSTYPIYETP